VSTSESPLENKAKGVSGLLPRRMVFLSHRHRPDLQPGRWHGHEQTPRETLSQIWTRWPDVTSYSVAGECPPARVGSTQGGAVRTSLIARTLRMTQKLASGYFFRIRTPRSIIPRWTPSGTAASTPTTDPTTVKDRWQRCPDRHRVNSGVQGDADNPFSSRNPRLSHVVHCRRFARPLLIRSHACCIYARASAAGARATDPDPARPQGAACTRFMTPR
jgi:hypothetical protein